MYFNWFKENNPHYKDIDFSEEMIHQFEKETMKKSLEFENTANKIHEGSNENEKILQSEKKCISKEVLDEFYNSDESDDEEDSSLFAHEKNIKMDQTSMFSDKYETDVNLPTVANRLANIIINFEDNNKINKILEDEFENEKSDTEYESEDERQLNMNVNESGIVITLEDINQSIAESNLFRS